MCWQTAFAAGNNAAFFTGSNGSAIGGAELGGGCRSRPCARGACIASVCVDDDRAVCCSFPATNFGHLWGGGGNVFQERGNEGKAREGRGKAGRGGEEGQGGEDCQTADMTNTGRISPSFTNEVGCERAAALLKVFNALRRC